MRVLLAICAVLIAVYSETTCPAGNNDEVPWGTGENMFATGECKDESDKCGSCAELCENESYSHWMQEHCASTCGLCRTTSTLRSESEKTCWKWGEGYADKNILERDLLVSMCDCRDKCLENEDCTGVFVTEYTKRNLKECVLVKAGELIKRKYMFGATKECLKNNPGKSCADNWEWCSKYSKMCTSRCPYFQSLMGMACRKTCKICVEPTFTWKTVEGKKMTGKVSEKKLKKDDATAKCEEQGNSCAGVTCKGKKCKVMASVKKLKSDTKFTSYEMKVES